MRFLVLLPKRQRNLMQVKWPMIGSERDDVMNIAPKCVYLIITTGSYTGWPRINGTVDTVDFQDFALINN